MTVFLVRSLHPSTEKYKQFERAFSDKEQAEEYAAYLSVSVFQPVIEEIRLDTEEFLPEVYWWYARVERNGYVAYKSKLKFAVLHRDSGYSPADGVAFAFGSTCEEAVQLAQEELKK